MRFLVLVVVLVAQSLAAAPREIDDHRWEGVERIVAIGDIHGDYDNYFETLRLAGIVNRRGRWIAGNTHLVQTGDIPDRGPDTRRIIRHLSQLARQARRAGGRVHHLIGNHEAMNVYGDLRYVSAGEFEAFVDRNSQRMRERYFNAYMDNLRETDPATFDNLPEDHRQQWEREHPPGWVEHRLAWDPRWNPDGEMFQWVMSSKVAIQLNDLVFLHGGISENYCHFDLASLTRMAREALRLDDSNSMDILVDETGPLWYRGLAGTEPATSSETVHEILRRHEANHIVIGHTPTSGVIWPRHSARVILIDTGMSNAYGGHIGWLEINSEGLFAGYPGGMLELPETDEKRLPYLERVMELQPENAHLRRRHESLFRKSEQADSNIDDTAPAREHAICGIAG